VKRIARSLLIAGSVVAVLNLASMAATHLPLGVQLVVQYLMAHPVFFALGIGCGLTNARSLAIAIAVVSPIVLWPCTAASVIAALTPMTLGILISRLVRLWMLSAVPQ
jgi:hypothetical protein